MHQPSWRACDNVSKLMVKSRWRVLIHTRYSPLVMKFISQAWQFRATNGCYSLLMIWDAATVIESHWLVVLNNHQPSEVMNGFISTHCRETWSSMTRSQPLLAGGFKHLWTSVRHWITPISQQYCTQEIRILCKWQTIHKPSAKTNPSWNMIIVCQPNINRSLLASTEHKLSADTWINRYDEQQLWIKRLWVIKLWVILICNHAFVVWNKTMGDWTCQLFIANDSHKNMTICQ